MLRRRLGALVATAGVSWNHGESTRSRPVLPTITSSLTLSTSSRVSSMNCCVASQMRSFATVTPGMGSSDAPPAWIENLRQDAKNSEKNISYDIKIYNDMAWRKKTFVFDRSAWDPNAMSSEKGHGTVDSWRTDKAVRLASDGLFSLFR